MTIIQLVDLLLDIEREHGDVDVMVEDANGADWDDVGSVIFEDHEGTRAGVKITR